MADTPTAPAPPAAPQDPAAPAPPAPAPPAAGAPPGSGSQPAEPQSFTREYVEELRREAAGHRTKAKDYEPDALKFRELKKAFGANGEPVDPATLLETTKAEVAKRDREIRRLKVTNALRGETAKHGVDYDLTEALLRDKLEEFDPDSPDFVKSLSSTITQAAKDKPAIKLQTAAPAPPTRSGGEFPGPGQTPSQQWTMDQLAAARKAGKVDEIQRALQSGQLNQILKRP